MGSIYDRGQKTASGILNRNTTGSVAYRTPDTFDEATPNIAIPGADHAVYGAVATPFKAQYRREQLADASIRLIFPQMDPRTGADILFTPTIDGTVTIDGAKYQIVEVTKTPAAGTIITWMLYLKA